MKKTNDNIRKELMNVGKRRRKAFAEDSVEKSVKRHIYQCSLAVSLIAIVGIVLYGLCYRAIPTAAEELRPYEEDIYYLTDRTVAEFQPVIMEKFNEESELVVLSVEAAETVDLKQMGILDWSILNKTQSLQYKGSGMFFVDLSALGEKNIALDNEKKTVIIEIPHAQMAPVDIDPEKFTAGETQKGFLAFGELKFTPQEYNNLEKEIRGRIEKAVNTESNLKKADELAVAEMKKMYEPVVRMIDDDYSVEIQFIR